MIVPHLVAENIIKYIPRHKFLISFSHINKYRRYDIFLEEKSSIRYGDKILVYVTAYYRPYDFKTLKTLRLVSNSFNDVLSIDILHVKYHANLFQKQYSTMIYHNNLLSECMLYYVFPLPMTSFLYRDWRIHQEHILTGMKSVICKYCFENIHEMFDYVQDLYTNYILLPQLEQLFLVMANEQADEHAQNMLIDMFGDEIPDLNGGPIEIIEPAEGDIMDDENFIINAENIND